MENIKRIYARIVARAWFDPGYSERLRTDAAGALRDAGVNVPHGTVVEVHWQEPPHRLHMTIPRRPGLIQEPDVGAIERWLPMATPTHELFPPRIPNQRGTRRGADTTRATGAGAKRGAAKRRGTGKRAGAAKRAGAKGGGGKKSAKRGKRPPTLERQ